MDLRRTRSRFFVFPKKGAENFSAAKWLWTAKETLPLKMAVFWDVEPCSLAVSSSERSVNIYQTTRRNIPEDSHLHTRRRENLNSQTLHLIIIKLLLLLHLLYHHHHPAVHWYFRVIKIFYLNQNLILNSTYHSVFCVVQFYHMLIWSPSINRLICCLDSDFRWFPRNRQCKFWDSSFTSP
jgi:hypothetical protein